MRWKRSGKIKGKPLESVAVVSMNLVLQCSGICSFLSDTHVFRSYISESGVKQTKKKVLSLPVSHFGIMNTD